MHSTVQLVATACFVSTSFGALGTIWYFHRQNTGLDWLVMSACLANLCSRITIIIFNKTNRWQLPFLPPCEIQTSWPRSSKAFRCLTSFVFTSKAILSMPLPTHLLFSTILLLPACSLHFYQQWLLWPSICPLLQMSLCVYYILRSTQLLPWTDP